MDAASKPTPHDLVKPLGRTPPLVVLTAPVIYSLIVPFALIDLWVSFYQAVCFPVYGVRRVGRGAFFKLDRAKLPYLNAIEKLNCVFCSYANGVIAFAREVAARTEQYWRPIKHVEDPLDPHERYGGFTEYGAADADAARQDELRAELRPQSKPRTVVQAVRPT